MPRTRPKKIIPDNHTTKYANQYKYAIVKTEITLSKPYTLTDKETLYAALNALQPAAFKVWTYLSAQANTSDRCTWDLSPQEIANVTGLSINGIRAALKEMEAKHFIINVNGKSRSKAFFERQTELPIFTELPKTPKTSWQ